MDYIEEMDGMLKRIEGSHINHDHLETKLNIEIEECSKEDYDLDGLLTPEIVRDILYWQAYPYSELNGKEKELFDKLIKTVISKLRVNGIAKTRMT